MQVPPEFLLFILLLATAVVFAYFYLKRAQRRTPKTTEAATPHAVDTATDRTTAEINATTGEE